MSKRLITSGLYVYATIVQQRDLLRYSRSLCFGMPPSKIKREIAMKVSIPEDNMLISRQFVALRFHVILTAEIRPLHIEARSSRP